MKKLFIIFIVSYLFFGCGRTDMSNEAIRIVQNHKLPNGYTINETLSKIFSDLEQEVKVMSMTKTTIRWIAFPIDPPYIYDVGCGFAPPETTTETLGDKLRILSSMMFQWRVNVKTKEVTPQTYHAQYLLQLK